MLKSLDLEEIKKGYAPGLTVSKGSFLLEACVCVVHEHNHSSGKLLLLTGDRDATIELVWAQNVDEQLKRTHNDLHEATEYGAECIAILLALKLEGYGVLKRSRQGTGFDYWLGEVADPLFEVKARLEVSGIFKGNENQVDHRFAEKTKQTKCSDETGLPAFISVTSFKQPYTKFAKVMTKEIQEIEELHNNAMEEADNGFMLKKKGMFMEARERFRIAMKKESAAAEMAREQRVCNFTEAILFRSAATLALDAQDYKEAEILIKHGLSGKPPAEIADEINDLFKDKGFKQFLKEQKIKISRAQNCLP